MRYFMICCFALLSCPAFAQPLQLTYQKTFTPNFFDYFLSSGQKDFYLSPDGSRLFISSDLRYQVLDASTGELLGEGDHIRKANAASASVLGILKNRSFNREDAIEQVRFDEGTEYLIVPEAQTAIILDWNVDQNLVKAVDLSSGELKWTIDRYRYSSSSKAQYVDLVLGLANAGRLQRNTPSDIAVQNAYLRGYGESAFLAADASPAAFGFLTPLGETGLVLLRVQDRYVALDLETGEEAWVYDQRKLNFGFAGMSEDGALVVVNFSSSYFQANERLIVKLDPLTGNEIWTAEHLSDFREGRTYLIGDRLVCDYYGAEVFDLNTGDRVLLSIDERTVKTQNTMTVMFNSDASGGRGTEAIASPSVVAGDALYTSTFELGNRVYANDGSSKALIQKYDLRSGEQLWESDKLAVGTDLSYASETEVFVRRGQAFGKSSLYVLDASTGKELTETDRIDGFIYREGAADVLTGRYLFRGGKKDVYAFDRQSWKLIETYDGKDARIGKLQAMVPGREALMAISEKGVAFFTGNQSASQVVQTAPLIGSFWNDSYGFLFSQDRLHMVDLDKQQEVASLPVVPSDRTIVLFSARGDQMLVIRDGQELTMYANPSP